MPHVITSKFFNRHFVKLLRSLVTTKAVGGCGSWWRLKLFLRVIVVDGCCLLYGWAMLVYCSSCLFMIDGDRSHFDRALWQGMLWNDVRCRACVSVVGVRHWHCTSPNTWELSICNASFRESVNVQSRSDMVIPSLVEGGVIDSSLAWIGISLTWFN